MLAMLDLILHLLEVFCSVLEFVAKAVLSLLRAFSRSKAVRWSVTLALAVCGVLMIGKGYRNQGTAFLAASAVSALAALIIDTERKPRKETTKAVRVEVIKPERVEPVKLAPVAVSAPVIAAEHIPEPLPEPIPAPPVISYEPQAVSVEPFAGKLNPFCQDVLKQEHILVAGTTGSGKSVFLNSLIYNGMQSKSFWYLIDPKRIDLKKWSYCENVVGYASNDEEALDILDEVESVMWERLGKIPKGAERFDGTPIYVVIDEMAFLLSYGEQEVIQSLSKIMRLGRAAGIHVIAATQAPNRAKGGGIPAALAQVFTASVGLRCRSAIESRQVIGTSGCETLPRYGKGYYWNPEGIRKVDIPMTEAEDLQRCAKHYE